MHPAIQIRSLRYTYPGRPAPALDEVSFEVAPREVFGFLGPSGAGKSTTQKILIRVGSWIRQMGEGKLQDLLDRACSS